MAKQKSNVKVELIVDKYKDNFTKLIKELKKLIQEGQRSGDILLTGAAYYHISIAYYDNNDWDKMFINAIKAVTYLDKTEEYVLIARAHISLSIAYQEQENFLLSFEECDKAYQIIKKHHIHSSLRIIALNNLATCYQMMNDTRNAVKIIDECIKQIKKYEPDDIEDLVMAIINKANFIKKSGRIDEALELLKSIHDVVDKVEFKPLVCDYYLRLALYAYTLNNNDEGKELVIKALSIVPDNMFPLPLYDDFREIGHIIVEQKEQDIAGQIYKLMNRFVENNSGVIEQTVAYRYFAEYYRGLNDHQKAFEYYVLLDEIYENRMEELEGAQCKAYSKMKLADEELNRLNKRMKEKDLLASIEPLTGLLNRSALLEVASSYIDTAFKKKQKVGAIFVDIDFFKECNDTYGHTKGDEIIRLIANICKEEETDNIRFARYGGDEFFGIMHGLKDDEVINIAKRIRQKINDMAIPNIQSPYKVITLSVGVINVLIKESTKTIIDMVKFADKAMYHAKNDGKNTIYLLEYSTDSDSLFKKIN